jgi:hypothetical protein
LLHQQEGIPNVVVMDGSKEQLFGKFCHKCRQEAGSHVKQTKPYTPWLNAMEAAIREVNQGAGHKMVCSHAPKDYGMIVSKEKP